MKRLCLVLLAALLCGASPAAKVRLASSNRVTEAQILGLKPVLWLNGKRTSSLTVGADGTISAWADKSGNGYTFEQSTAANKPYLTRSDNLENRIPYSQQFDQTVGGWAKINTSVIADATTAPDGTETADRIAETAVTNLHYVNSTFETVKGATYTTSVYAKRWNGRNYFQLSSSSGGFPVGTITFNLNTGAVSGSSGAATGTIEDAGSGWYRCNMTITSDESSTSASTYFLIVSDDGTTINYLGDITKGIYLWGAQIRRSSTSSTYLATTTYPQYAGLNGRAVPYFPGAATYMSRAFTAALDIGVGDNTIFAVAQLDNNGADSGTTFYILDTETYQARGGSFRISGGASNGLPRLRTSQAGADTYIQSSTVISGLNLFAGIKSGTTGQLYRNGALDGSSATVSNAVSSSPNELSLGNYRSSGANGLRGYLPEVLIFNRALSNNEMALVKRWEAQEWPLDMN